MEGEIFCNHSKDKIIQILVFFVSGDPKEMIFRPRFFFFSTLTIARAIHNRYHADIYTEYYRVIGSCEKGLALTRSVGIVRREGGRERE